MKNRQIPSPQTCKQSWTQCHRGTNQKIFSTCMRQSAHLEQKLFGGIKIHPITMITNRAPMYKNLPGFAAFNPSLWQFVTVSYALLDTYPLYRNVNRKSLQINDYFEIL